MQSLTSLVLPWTALFRSKVAPAPAGAIEQPAKIPQKGGAEAAAAAAGSVSGLLVGIVAVTLGIFAAYLAWRCNVKEDYGLRVIYTLLAFANAIPYLIYYLVIRVLMGHACRCCE